MNSQSKKEDINWKALTEEQWRARLTPEQFEVLRNKGTERAFSSESCRKFDPGDYSCAGCGQLLFRSQGKFDSGTGWPSFTAPVGGESVREIEDSSCGMSRTEVICSRCDGHLGHVFDDGPPPNHKRYCINALSLKFAPTP
ncbi:MAG: peptide-methionine (R)-S-oxide reductase [Bdellovibrionales bacterium CG10_big_fil_rev_8_21_14_0_10_45_34]|nr:MAG: peptide-methionine (R)-S-oxide reductase [Bdellovibrionales bacterium CG10_big_fil_rev_8_21_14_0_10_45_34]